MKIKAAFILSLLTLMLCACGKGSPTAPAASETESPAATAAPVGAPASDALETLSLYKDIQFYEDRQGDMLLCRVEYPVLMMDSSQSGSYAVADSLDAFNATLAAQASESYSRLLNSVMADIELNMDNAGGYYSKTDIFVPRADSLALSVLCRTESFSGGAQPSLSYSCMNFDSRTGRQLALKNVTADAAAVTELIKAQLEKDYPKAKFYDLAAAMEQYAQEPERYVWTLDYHGLSFYFAPYELAPYEEGSFTVGLRFADHPELFSLYYSTRQPYSYAVPVIEGRCLNYDIDGDGISDLIRLNTNDDHGVINRLDITAMDRSLSVNTLMEGLEAYVVYAGPSRNFLFINAHNAGGYGFISVYRLERSGISLVGMLYDTSLQAAGFTPECAGIPLLTKPEKLLLGTKIELMGKLTGIKDYSFGSSGMPESPDEYYRVYANTTLTAEKDFATAAIDMHSGRGLNTAAQIKAGTRLFFHRSDGRSFVDMITEDGVCCRMYVSGKGQAQTVNAMPVTELFTGVVY